MSDKPFVAKNAVLIQNSNTVLSQNSLVVGNSTVNSTVNSTASYFGNSTANAVFSSTSAVVSNSSNTTTITPLGLQAGASVINTTALAVSSFVANSSGAYVGANVQWSATGGFIGNSTVNASFTATQWQLANSTTSLNISSLGIVTGLVTHNSTVLAVGSNVIVNSSAFAIGNSTVYQQQIATLLSIVGTAGTANLNQNGLSVGISSINSTAWAVGANVVGNASTISWGGTVTVNSSTAFFGNSTVNSYIVSTLLSLANSTSSANITSGGLQAGYVAINTTAAAVGANVVMTASGLGIGNSTVNSSITSSLIAVANSSGQVNVSAIDVKVGSTVVNTTAFGVGNTIANSTTLALGNSTVYQRLTSTAASISDTNSTMNLSSYGLIAGSVVVNTSIVKVGANVSLDAAGFTSGATVVNASVITSGNSSINVYANSTLLRLASGGVTANISASEIKVGISTVNTTGIATGNTVLNGASVVIGNSSVNTTMNSTVFTGTSYTSNNSTYLGGQLGSYYSNLDNATGTLAGARTSAAAAYVGNTFVATTYLYSSGHVYAVGDVYSSYSDARLKIDIEQVKNALAAVNSFKVISYKQNPTLSKELGVPENNNRQLGLIAQEVKAVYPELVALASFDRKDDGTSRSGEDYMTINYQRLVPILVAAIQELSAKVNILEAKFEG